MSPATLSAPLMACRRVTVLHGYGAAQIVALCDVDLELAEGERVALFGASGSGKTTLLHVLAGLIVPDRGEVSWQGSAMPSLQAAAHRRGAGAALVFQNANLLPTFTAAENVAFAALAAGPDRLGVGDADRVAAELLERVDLGAKRDALPGELSGGEAQRVALARALAQRPQVLLCDEPTGHLDSETARRVLDLVDALHDEFGFAQVTATHDADVAARYRRAVGLADGRVTGEERFG
jgi:ABC-type lipoprotein export system ATPase subunit